MAFDAADRLTVGKTAGSDFAVLRYLGPDPVVEAGSATFAADLQSAVTALDVPAPAVTPRVVIHVSDPSQTAAVVSALAGLSDNPAGPNIEVLLDVELGSYRLGPVSVPAGLRLILDGGGCGEGAFASSSGPVLTLLSGDVLIRDGALFSSTANAPTILVQGGRLTVRGSTIQETTGGSQPALSITGGSVDLGTSTNPVNPGYGGNTLAVNGPGLLIRLNGPNNALVLGDTFLTNGQPFADNFAVEDLVEHSLDGLGGGTVFWSASNVYVSKAAGSVQRGVDVAPAGGTVNVQAGVHGDYYVGARLLPIAHDDGTTITQQADSLDAGKRSLTVWGSFYNDTIKFVASPSPGQVQLNVNNLPRGTFLPTGRLIAYAEGYGDDVQVDGALTLSAWLYGDGGNDRLRGGGGDDVLIGNGPGDLLSGGPGQNLLIGTGGDRLASNGGQDILIAGSTAFDSDEAALAAILAEWSSARSLAARVANLTGNTSSPYFSATRLNGNYFLLDGGPDQTVFNDFSADTVVAGSGGLVFSGTADKLSGLTASDVAFIFGP